MESWLIWILAGLVLLGAELAVPGAFLIWAGLAAVGTGLVVLLAAPAFPLSVLLFIGLMAAGVALGLRRRGQAGAPVLNTPESGLAGRTGIVVASDATGLRVRVGDVEWPALPSSGGLLPGRIVHILGVEGTALRVRGVDGADHD